MRAMTNNEAEAAVRLCAARGHTTATACTTCRADIMRLVDGVPAGEATKDGLAGDILAKLDRWNGRLEMLTYNERLAVWGIVKAQARRDATAPQALPTRAEVEKVVDAYKRLVMEGEEPVEEGDFPTWASRFMAAEAAPLALIPTQETSNA